ncbi:MAG: putative anti-sigma regulatory factor, serine/threonine protein kinase [Solirubrobacterales bacterium]|nr:putative anti-sigma regulatory factor, serine/threonine protein kinase [Solirubrobacterales bacterium]
MSSSEHQRGFPPRASSPAAARRWVVGALGLRGAAAEDVAIIVSELVTNAYLHAGLATDESIVVRAGWLPDRETVRVRVCDPGGRFAQPSATPHRKHGGRGLGIVSALSETWGVDLDGQTTTWFVYRPEESS